MFDGSGLLASMTISFASLSVIDWCKGSDILFTDMREIAGIKCLDIATRCVRRPRRMNPLALSMYGVSSF